MVKPTSRLGRPKKRAGKIIAAKFVKSIYLFDQLSVVGYATWEQLCYRFTLCRVSESSALLENETVCCLHRTRIPFVLWRPAMLKLYCGIGFSRLTSQAMHIIKLVRKLVICFRSI